MKDKMNLDINTPPHPDRNEECKTWRWVGVFTLDDGLFD